MESTINRRASIAAKRWLRAPNAMHYGDTSAHRHVRMVSGLGSTALAQQFDRDRCAAVNATCPPSHEYPLPMPATSRCLPGPVVAVGS